MNQNPPPRDPNNPYGTERRDGVGNQQNPMGQPAPPPGGHVPPRPAPGGYPPPGGHGHMPGHGHYPPPHHHPHGGHDPSPMSTQDWLITLLIYFIPCVNIVMLCIWAFSSTGNLNRRNYARALLVFVAIAIVLSIFLGITLGTAISNAFNFVW